MANKHSSCWGFFLSLLFHCSILAGVCYTLQSDNSANGYQAEIIGTNISMEMLQGMVIESEPEPEPEPEPETEPKFDEPMPIVEETISDPTLKEKKIKKEIKKEKPKQVKKERQKKQEIQNKDLPKGERNVDSEAKIDSIATNLGSTTSSNPNLVGTGNSADEIAAYKQALRREIEKNKRYPQRAKLMRKQGRVQVSFILENDGSISNVSLESSSGNADLDNAAIQAVKHTRSVGPKPRAMPAKTSVPIRFSTY